MPRLILLNHPLSRLAFWLLLCVTTYLMLISANDIPKEVVFWDKLQHFICFTVLSIAGVYGYTYRPVSIFLGLYIYGALIEVAQSTFTHTRHGDPYDWLADIVGILFVAGIYCFIYLKCRNSA